LGERRNRTTDGGARRARVDPSVFIRDGASNESAAKQGEARRSPTSRPLIHTLTPTRTCLLSQLTEMGLDADGLNAKIEQVLEKTS